MAPNNLHLLFTAYMVAFAGADTNTGLRIGPLHLHSEISNATDSPQSSFIAPASITTQPQAHPDNTTDTLPVGSRCVQTPVDQWRCPAVMCIVPEGWESQCRVVERDRMSFSVRAFAGDDHACCGCPLCQYELRDGSGPCPGDNRTCRFTSSSSPDPYVPLGKERTTEPYPSALVTLIRSHTSKPPTIIEEGLVTATGQNGTTPGRFNEMETDSESGYQDDTQSSEDSEVLVDVESNTSNHSIAAFPGSSSDILVSSTPKILPLCHGRIESECPVVTPTHILRLGAKPPTATEMSVRSNRGPGAATVIAIVAVALAAVTVVALIGAAFVDYRKRKRLDAAYKTLNQHIEHKDIEVGLPTCSTHPLASPFSSHIPYGCNSGTSLLIRPQNSQSAFELVSGRDPLDVTIV